MTQPTLSVFEEDPRLKKAMEELLRRAEETMEEMEKMGEAARNDARDRGYIPSDSRG
jgi:hypothetical protein